MADSGAFTFATPGVGNARQAAAVGPVVGVTGESGGSFLGPVKSSGGNMAATIPNFLQKLAAPRVEAVKQLRRAEGFAAARAGMTQEEIKKNTPYFARLFGDTEFQAGSTIWNAQSAVSEISREATENMEELKTRTPEEMGAWLNERAERAKTGDPLADAVIQKSLMEQSGPLMAMQTKARFAWQQTTMVNDQYNSALSEARNFEAGTRMQWQLGQDYPDQQPDPAQQAERERLFFDTFQMPEGQTYESALNFIERTSEGLAREGLWHSLDFLENTGMYQQLPADVQERIAKKVQTANSRWRSNLEGTDELQEAYQIRALGAAGILTPNQLYQQMTGFNQKFKSRTGSRVPYFDEGELKGAITGNAALVFQAHQRNLDKLDRLNEKAQDAQAKEAAQAETDAAYMKESATGGLGPMSLMSHYDEKLAERSITALIEKDPAKGVEALQRNFANPYKRWESSTVKGRIEARIEAGAGFAMNDAVDQSYAMWKQMFYSEGVGKDQQGIGPAMANSYFGKYADHMFAFDQAVQMGVSKEDAYQKIFGKDSVYAGGDLRGGQGFSDNQKALQNAVAQLSPNWWDRWVGGKEAATPMVQGMIAHHGSRFYERMLKQSPYLSPDVIAQQAVQYVQSNGLEIAGGKYAWMNGAGQKNVADELKIPRDVFGGVFDTAVTNKMRKQGLKVDSGTNFEIIRVGNDKDGPRMLVTGYDSDGVRKAIELGGKDFATFRDEFAEKVYKQSDWTRWDGVGFKLPRETPEQLKQYQEASRPFWMRND